ncbi:MAG: carbohydrate ABC transporter substrate-binding protein [Limnoraphis sp. WC205]|jgi:multiple sugar transport system substrate-binding protein|nr:carbohydrate ABC transporter substrate-binding protein [Limnoraphis sp. WC205]
MLKLTPVVLFFLSWVLVTCTQSKPDISVQTFTDNNTSVKISWTNGYYPQEDEAIQQIVRQWENESGFKAELTFLAEDVNLQQTQAAIKADNPPDIVYNQKAEFALNPLMAWEGKVAEVSEVVEPMQERYSSSATRSAYLYNTLTDQQGYYAVPIHQQTLHIHYWRDLLNEAGFTDSDIPKQWDDFWEFWQQVQDQLRQQGKEDIYGIGLTLSSEANDTFYEFEQVLAAYRINLLDEKGQLKVEAPQVRQGIIEVLEWFADFYKQGYVPVDAVDWLPADNNVNFLNRRLVMTLNPTLSIPASQRSDEQVYRDKIVTLEFPNNPDGNLPQYLVSVKQVLSFAASAHQKAAQSFLSFLAKPTILNQYLKQSAGRYFPVMPELLSDPFWNNSDDPHISVARQQFASTLPLNSLLYPAYAKIFAENLWGQALEKIVVEGVSSEAAADEVIQRIKMIFEEWEQLKAGEKR